MKGTPANAELLATTLPTATLVAEQKYCNASEAAGATPTIAKTAAATANSNFSPTYSRSIFSWLRSATKAARIDSNKAASNSCAAEGVAPAAAATTTARALPADSTLLNSYREFRGVQSLRHLWNKRISASEDSNAPKTTANAKAEKLNKSISCLVSVPGSKAGEHKNDDDSDYSATAKRRETRTKRARSLHDCTQLAVNVNELAADCNCEPPRTREIDTLHRERDNFYKYKNAEQSLKQRTRQATARCRSSAGVLGADQNLTQGFPAIDFSGRGEGIHWLRRDDIKMTANQHSPDSMQQQQEALARDRASCDDKRPTTAANERVAHSEATTDACESDKNLISDTHSLNSLPAQQTNDCLVKRSESCTRLRKNASTARKYSFKTHVKSYHAPRNRIKADGSASAGSGSGATGYSLVAQLTQQFNEIIQKDKTLLEEVKRKNGVLMSRGGHVYKVIEKSDHHPTSRGSPGVSRTNSKVKDLQSMKAASTVRRAIKKIEGSAAPGGKPQVPTKSLQVLRKREELVSNKSQQQNFTKAAGDTKRRANAGKAAQPSDKAERQLKAESNKLEVVTEESSKSLMEGDDKLDVRVLQATQSTSAADDSNDKRIIDVKINDNCEQSKDGKNGSGDKATEQQQNKLVIRFVNETEDDDMLEKRLSPEGQAEVSNRSKRLTQHLAVPRAGDAEEDDVTRVTAGRGEAITTSFPTTADADTKAKENNDEDGDDNEVDEEKLKRRKHRYAKIYEKFRFRSPFHGGQNKKSIAIGSPTSGSPVNESSANGSPERNITKPQPEPTTSEVTTVAVGQRDEADAKILAALDAIDLRLRDLKAQPTTTILLRANDDFEQRLLPNSSFIYQTTTEQILSNQLTVTQAVNVTLVNTIGGEQMQKEQEERLLREKIQRLSEKVIEIEVTKKHGDTDWKQEQEGKTEQVNYRNSQGDYEMRDDHKSKPEEPLGVVGEERIGGVSQEENEEIRSSVETESQEKERVGESEFKDEEEGISEKTHIKSEEGDVMDEETKEMPIQEEIPTVAETHAEGGTEVNKDEEVYIIITDDNESKTEDLNLQKSSTFESSAITRMIDEDVYQTLEEVSIPSTSRSHPAEAVNQLTGSIASQNDYESIAGSSEHSAPVATQSSAPATTTLSYDGYESFEPLPDDRRPPPAPTSPTSPPILTLVRKTTDELPALPEPKRRLRKSPMLSKKLPPTPPPAYFRSTSSPHANAEPPAAHFVAGTRDDNDEDQHYYADDENIYDTIKGGSHCYESLQALSHKKPSPQSLDDVSLGSNCYESIAHYRRTVSSSAAFGVGASRLRSAGSTSTISSDQKTNSLYEVSLASGRLYGAGSVGTGVDACRSSLYRSGDGNADIRVSVVNGHRYSNSIAASSEGNSDEWIDITDNEADDSGAGVGGRGGVKQQFIVVRERTKLHRSPDWSKRVRDKRLQQKNACSFIEDDSDHYYESLSPSPGNKRHSTQLTGSHHKRNQDLARHVLSGTQPRQQHSASAHALGRALSDDYDSFDTDTDDIYETEEQLKNHHDSGVDIRNVKLPDPPPSTNQVYAMVKKFKNFISSKKSPSGSKYSGSQLKIYENSSQFYVEGNIYQVSPKSGKTANNVSSSKQSGLKTSISRNDDYENTEFHTPLAIITSATKQMSTSEKNLSMQRSNAELAATPPAATATTTPRSKSKSGKSFKSRLRKSLVGSSFDTKQLSTLTPARSTFYVDDPIGSGELDSGFSEKVTNADEDADAAADRTASSTNASTTTLTSESQKFSTVSRKSKKDVKSANAQRRRTTIGIRPLEPPPPPPPVEDAAQLRARHRDSAAPNTSWYAECGVFKNSATLNADHTMFNGGGGGGGSSGGKSSCQNKPANGGSHTSWYAEAGLYQTSGASVASSSGSSGVSTGNEAGMGDDMPHGFFQNEPLYQIYSAAKLQSISRDLEDQDAGSSTDGYEEIGQLSAADELARTEISQRHSRPSALQLVGPKTGPARTLWSEIPEVINSCLLLTLTPRERAVQEAKFEIITSEASYLKSLNLLRSHFMNHPMFRDTSVVSARDRKSLFAHIVPVHECSERLLAALESCWQDNIMLLGLSKRIYAVAEKHFHVYIAFCEQQGRMDRTLRRLKEAKGTFAQNLDLLESSPTCCGLNLHSFLMLPMQRITRLPLLIDAVFSKTGANDDEYEDWKMTLAIMNKIVTQCNEAANRCEQAYEIERIARQLEFPTTVRALAIAPVGVAAPGSKPRFLVKKGELTHLVWRGDDAKLTFGKKFTKSAIYAFLFSDLLVLTKRKGEQVFQVFDYCPRNMLTISSGDLLPQLPTKDIQQSGKNMILMTLLENHERKTVELVLSCPSVSEQERWLQAMRPPEAETPGEKLYEQWDCPQVVTTHAYESTEPDALTLDVGDVVNVTRKLPDGWYQGERIRDGAIGWFPGNHTEEVNSAHVRARNLKQRYRLLTFTASYLETQKRK